jgi:predicted carbohydrate-binding protein with CBM5 and CBM33 domain
VRAHQLYQSGGRPRPVFRHTVRTIVLLLTAAVGLVTWSGAAQAHGTVVGPATRAYQCWKDWGSNHMSTAMATEDPMCWQAFQANADTMWNWMSALRDGLGGNFQAATPDGQLCSNALTRNDSLNKPGAWRTTSISGNFSIHLYDQASHGADFFRVYLSKNGYDPTTQSLGWGNLNFITETGSYAPATDITFNVSTSGYTGHHVLFVIWQASHQDQAYMWCSDVTFA